MSDDLTRSIVMGAGETGSFSIDLSLDQEAALVFIRKADDLSTDGFNGPLYGAFRVELEGEPVDGISSMENEADWSEELKVPIPAGDQTVSWIFERADVVPDEAFDVFAYVDGIRFLPDLEIL